MLTYPTRRRLGSYVPQEATLILNFEERRAVQTGKQINLESIITFDRNGPAWGMGDGGVYRLHGVNEMRLGRPGVGPEGVLLERQATNLMLYSRDISQSAWSKTAMTISQVGVGIDGGETVARCTDTAPAGSAFGRLSQVRPIPSTNQWLTCSIYVRQTKGTRIRAYIGIVGGSSVKGGEAIFDTRIGAVASAQSGIVARVEPASMGFIRICLSILNDVGATACVMEVSRENNAADPIAFDADFGQMEVTSRASSPILTTNSQADRAGERVRINPLDDWFNPYEGTLYVECSIGGAQENDRAIARLAGPNGSVNIVIGGTTLSVLKLDGSGSVLASGDAAGYINPPRRLRLAMRYKENDFAFSVRGVQTPYDDEALGTPRVIPLTGATTVPTYTNLEIGANVGTNQADGTISKLIYIPYALDDTRLSAAVL